MGGEWRWMKFIWVPVLLLVHSSIHSPTHSFLYPFTNSLPSPVTHSLTHSLTHTLTRSPTHPHVHSITQSPINLLVHFFFLHSSSPEWSYSLLAGNPEDGKEMYTAWHDSSVTPSRFTGCRNVRKKFFSRLDCLLEIVTRKRKGFVWV